MNRTFQPKYKQLRSFESLNNFFQFIIEPSETDWQNVCAASILSQNILMTAAHCIRSHDSTRKVLLGQSMLNSDTYDSTRQLLNIVKGGLISESFLYLSLFLQKMCPITYSLYICLQELRTMSFSVVNMTEKFGLITV